MQFPSAKLHSIAVCSALAGLALVGAVPSHGAEPAGPVFTDAASAGLEYQLQGEYAGRVGNQQLGAQVVAHGDGNFEAVFFPGGLPGTGWDGKVRFRVNGIAEGGVGKFGTSGVGWSGLVNVDQRRFTGQSDAGVAFDLKKVNRTSPTQGLKPPPGALVLFDGHNAEAFSDGKMTEDGLLQAGATTKRDFRDFTLHVEYKLPFVPKGTGEGRANSGVYIQKRYEIQILDSFGRNEGTNEAAGIYTRVAPKVNMSYPPLTWQTYDIDFQAAQWDAAGNKTKNAVVTVKHNGVTVQDHVEIVGKTGAGEKEAPNPRPIYLQLHGAPVVFRNVWVVDRSGQ